MSANHLSLPAARRVVVAGACLAMAYVQLTLSPATIDFSRELGATDFHIGILAALPIGLLFMQLVSALVVNRLPSRKWLWFSVSIVQRLTYLPVAVGPWLFPDASDRMWVWTLIGVAAANQALLHFCSPLWLSWMGDYLPHEGLSQFWGRRHRFGQWTAAAALLGASLLLMRGGTDIRTAFALLTGVGVVCGVLDILLFIKVEEPPLQRLPQPTVWNVLADPFRNADYRGFIGFSCFWNFAAMIGAPFISLYLLQYIGMDLFHVLLLWTLSWVGGALGSQALGALADKHGQRPVLVLCTAFKSITMGALLLLPKDSGVAFWVLIPIFMIDALLNAGILIANNGYMIKNSPSANRTMFIAAGTAFAGVVGGVTSIVAGLVLAMTSDWHGQLLGVPLINYHVAFAISFALRIMAALLATRVREARSDSTSLVMRQIVTAILTPVQHHQARLARLTRWPLRGGG